MFKDWNFWLALITAVIAIYALYQTSVQIRLSNKQFLFDKRLKVYMIVDGLMSLCNDNPQIFKEYRKSCRTNDLNFIYMINNTYLEEQADVIKNTLSDPYHKNFLKKIEELETYATEATLIFNKKYSNTIGGFVNAYKKILFKMYQYQILTDNIGKEIEKHPTEFVILAERFGEEEHRKEVRASIEELERYYNEMLVIDDKIKKQIKLR